MLGSVDQPGAVRGGGQALQQQERGPEPAPDYLVAAGTTGAAGCIAVSRPDRDAAAVWYGVMLAACAMSSHWYSPPRNVTCWVCAGSPANPPPA